MAEGGKEADHLVARETVENIQTLFAAGDQAGLAQLLEVLRGIRHRRPGQRRELLDAALRLGKELEKLDAGGAGKRRADARQVGEDVALGVG